MRKSWGRNVGVRIRNTDFETCNGCIIPAFQKNFVPCGAYSRDSRRPRLSPEPNCRALVAGLDTMARAMKLGNLVIGQSGAIHASGFNAQVGVYVRRV